MSERVAIIGTGLIGASIGLALKASGFPGEIVGFDRNPVESAKALEIGAVDRVFASVDEVLGRDAADIYVLAVPVLVILDWMQKLSSVSHLGQLVTDVGSTKVEICTLGEKLFNGPGQAVFLPGHPMAGKESGGAALADAGLFKNAMWLFTTLACGDSPMARRWQALVTSFGASVREIDEFKHDEVCAWVSHLPQMVSTAMSAMLEDRFADDREGMAAVQAIGGRALREMTRLGSSPYSMWRDVAMTNPKAIAETLHALEQRLAHVRENLKTPELREEFAKANRFRKQEIGSRK
jgi:prephenate dehydrogenase